MDGWMDADSDVMWCGLVWYSAARMAAAQPSMSLRAADSAQARERAISLPRAKTVN